MHPIHDADALLLLAITLASKRKPAAVDDIAIALGMLQPRLPLEAKLLDAFARLTSHGLIVATDGTYALSVEAQKLMKGVAIKGETAERTEQVKERLAASNVKAKHTPSQPEAAALSAAIVAWRAALPPPTKTEKFAQQRETRLQEVNAKRAAEGKPPKTIPRPGPKGPKGPRGPRGPRTNH